MYMLLKYSMRSLWPIFVFLAVPIAAEEIPRGHGHTTIEELFEAYRQASQTRDWEAMFLLRTPECQNAMLLNLAVSAAISKDNALRAIVEKHGVHWKLFDLAWTEEENQRFMKESSALAAQIGKQAAKKVQLFVEARAYIQKAAQPSATKVHELQNLVQKGKTATGDSIETNTVTENRFDAQGKLLGQIWRDFSITAKLSFRQIDGKWYLETAQ